MKTFAFEYLPMELPWSEFIATPPSFASSSQFGSVPEAYTLPVPPPDFSSCFAPLSGELGADLPEFGAKFPPPSVDFNEIENRALLLTNLDPSTSGDEIDQSFSTVGPIRVMDTSALDSGSATVEFFDLRHANQLRRSPIPIVIRGRPIALAYAPLPPIEDPRSPPNNGTIVVFHLPTGITNQQIEATFRPFGEIRQVRGTPSKPSQKFVEYWDVRDAQKALDALNGQYLMGSRVSIEFSLPGGFRRNVQQPSGRRT
jgi:RNA recognition motif-containing protein